MNRFTVEETNLISIYIADTRRELIGEMTGALYGRRNARVCLAYPCKAPRHERRRLCRSRRICRRRSMSGLKRLTPQQSRKANALIKKTCCNCMGGNCILLDDGDECVCPQLISYSLLCRWFQNAVLPADKLLYAELYQAEDRRRCVECGAAFASTSNSVKYCPDCRKRITRRQAAERMRKRRARVTQ